MHRTNIILGIVFFCMGLILFFWIIPTQVQGGEDSDALSPRFFPNMAALAFIILGPILSFSSFKQAKQALAPADENSERTDRHTDQTGETAQLSVKNLAHLVLYLTVLSVNLFLFRAVGFKIAAPVTVISFMLLHGGKAGLLVMLLTAASGTAVIYLLAWGVFDIPLP